MQPRKFILFLFLILMAPAYTVYAQEKGDSLIIPIDTLVHKSIHIDTLAHKPPQKAEKKDSVEHKKFDPRKATLRSAIIPGWGQAYNKKYWKIPIVYGALGVSAGIFISNLKTYRELRQAVIIRLDGNPGNDTLIAPELAPLSTGSLQSYRNTYRQYIDYSVLAFLALWGLNVVDATVDAHLKGFNVSPDLSLKIRPSYQYFTRSAGISLVLSFREKAPKVSLPH